jgi:hypothetical protein
VTAKHNKGSSIAINANLLKIIIPYNEKKNNLSQ